MYKNIFLYLTILLFVGCGGVNEITKKLTSQKVDIPFNESKYRSDNDYFRATQSAKSDDISTAKIIATQLANEALATIIGNLIELTNDTYIKQIGVGKEVESKRQFEQLGGSVVSQQLKRSIVIGEEVFTDSDGYFTYWIVVELSAKPILNEIVDKISDDKELKLGFDKKAYEETYKKKLEEYKKAQNAK